MASDNRVPYGLQPSPRIAKLVKQFEGLRLQSYKDVAGHRTIGWGHLLPPGPVEVWTKEQAERVFAKDLADHARAVDDLVTVPLHQYEFDALVSFVFNVGSGAFAKSTMLKMLNQKQYGRVPGQFGRWNKAGGKVVKGLTERRRIERAIWLNEPW